MKTIEIHSTNDHKVNVDVHFRSHPSGYGHYKIFCEAQFEGNKKTFKHTTNDMPWIDSLSSFKADDPSWEDVQNFYLEKFQSDFEERINEWVDERLNIN